MTDAEVVGQAQRSLELMAQAIHRMEWAIKELKNAEHKEADRMILGRVIILNQETVKIAAGNIELAKDLLSRRKKTLRG